MGLFKRIIYAIYIDIRQLLRRKDENPDSVFDWTVQQMQKTLEKEQKAIVVATVSKKLLHKRLSDYKRKARYWHLLAEEAANAGDNRREQQALTCRHVYCTLVRDLLYILNRGTYERRKIS